MQFDISITYKHVILFLEVKMLDGGRFFLKTIKQLSDEVHDFPATLELMRNNEQWHYSITLSEYMKEVIPAIEHYLKHMPTSDIYHIKQNLKRRPA